MQFPDNVTRLCGLKRFTFGCHPGVACFTECCRELDLVLTPYDVYRLCKDLQVKPADFIDRFALVEQDDKTGFPVLYLGMVDDGHASCPFIGEEGCQVYRGRPGACRAYPVGRGTTLDSSGRKQELHVLIREDHCLGFEESGNFTVAEWFENQGLAEYNQVNDEVLTLLKHEKVTAGYRLSRQQFETVLLALYRLDEFRKLVESWGDAEKYTLTEEERRKILADDLALLRFAVSWLKNTLFHDDE